VIVGLSIALWIINQYKPKVKSKEKESEYIPKEFLGKIPKDTYNSILGSKVYSSPNVEQGLTYKIHDTFYMNPQDFCELKKQKNEKIKRQHSLDGMPMGVFPRSKRNR